MIHPQERRDITEASAEVAQDEVVAHQLPRQKRRGRDAYDVYAQIYALRTEGPTA